MGSPAPAAGTHETVLLKADAEAAAIAASLGYTLVPHCALKGAELARNRQQVAVTDYTVAAPSGNEARHRSGTWATVRYAQATGQPVILLARGTP